MRRDKQLVCHLWLPFVNDGCTALMHSSIEHSLFHAVGKGGSIPEYTYVHLIDSCRGGRRVRKYFKICWEVGRGKKKCTEKKRKMASNQFSENEENPVLL